MVERLEELLGEEDDWLVSMCKNFGLIAQSPCWEEILSTVRRIAKTKESVLIFGETGVGKEIIAKMIHRLSARFDSPFVEVNCAAVPDALIESEFFGHERGSFTGATQRHIGCIEEANNGSIFLDEIGEMPHPLQARLLRVLDDGKVKRVGSGVAIPVDVRFIAATNRDIDQAIEEKYLRKDIYYRFAYKIRIPSLRERQEDVVPLLLYYFQKSLEKHSLNPRTPLTDDGGFKDLRNYSWPGNVRELKSLIDAVLIELPENIRELKTSQLAANLKKTRRV